LDRIAPSEWTEELRKRYPRRATHSRLSRDIRRIDRKFPSASQ
jgi:hypothetical protein